VTETQCYYTDLAEHIHKSNDYNAHPKKQYFFFQIPHENSVTATKKFVG